MKKMQTMKENIQVDRHCTPLKNRESEFKRSVIKRRHSLAYLPVQDYSNNGNDIE